MSDDSAYWADYYKVTVDRPAWAKEEDSQTALGSPHHLHLIEFVAQRVG